MENSPGPDGAEHWEFHWELNVHSGKKLIAGEGEQEVEGRIFSAVMQWKFIAMLSDEFSCFLCFASHRGSGFSSKW